jgi:mono/diheme cytochrome c family protein
MSASSRKQLAGTVFVLLLVIAAGSAVYAFFHPGPWIVPEEAKKVPNPLKPSQENLAGARKLYSDKCAECHGESGKGDGNQSRMYNTPPTNFTDRQRMNAESDGELFYKLSEGHRPMPSFKKRYSEEQRWQLILFLRKFAANPEKTSANRQ